MQLHAFNARTMADSEYTGLSLLAIAVHDGRMFGITTTQLLEFTGTDDDGTDIDAYVETGKMDFNDSTLKRFPKLYIGGSASGGLSVVVTTEEGGSETSRTYPVSAWVGNLFERKVSLARYPKSRHVQIKIQNVDGGTFQLENAKLFVDGLQRQV